MTGFVNTDRLGQCERLSIAILDITQVGIPPAESAAPGNDLNLISRVSRLEQMAQGVPTPIETADTADGDHQRQGTGGRIIAGLLRLSRG